MPDETNLLGERAYLTLPSHAALPGSDRLRVGLAWAGNPHHKNDANRSIAWEQFATLTELDGVDFFSLQVRPRATDCGGSEVVSLEGQLNDVAATAAVMTVDTAVAHLAGALGKPTWVLITAMPDWRWQLKPNRQPVVFAGETLPAGRREGGLAEDARSRKAGLAQALGL